MYNIAMKVKTNKKELKKKQNAKKLAKDKESYFAFYDDVKHYSKGKEDW